MKQLQKTSQTEFRVEKKKKKKEEKRKKKTTDCMSNERAMIIRWLTGLT